jgi:hypothetical protein
MRLRLGLLTFTLALVVLPLAGSLEHAAASPRGSRTEVVVTLSAPPLAYEPGGRALI